MTARTLRGQLAAAREKLFPRTALACAEKVRYSTEGMAKIVIRNRYASKRDLPASLRAYECSDCGGWHLTKRVNTSPESSKGG